MADDQADYLKHWVDHPENPLIAPPFPEFLLGDPSVVPPGQSPDELWHMFANTLRGIHHFTSVDGVHWRRRARVFPGMRAFVYREEDLYYLFYEEFSLPMFRSHLSVRTSSDLRHWSEGAVVLEAELDWETRLGRTCGNPCLVKSEDGYLLYYSAALVFLRDLGFCEPLNIGLARAESVEGPYRKLREPIIAPSRGNRYRNLGAGAIKVMYDPERRSFYGFNNGIYSDEANRTRSAILLLSSADGVTWEQLYDNPIIAPSGEGWKKALVYQLDVRRVGDEMWLWYNARSGWRFGVERIGLAISPA
jgi:predicted GH43/DUF377 family glycosyl hydrolase